MRKAVYWGVWALMAFFLVQPASRGLAAEAADPAVHQIETFYTKLVETMKRGKELGIDGRYRQLAPAVEAVFDLPGMARLSVGPAWNMLTEMEHSAIVQAFTRMTVANYAKNFTSFDGERFVTDPKVQMRNEDKIVESKLVGSDKSATPFNYRMRQVDGMWKIIDVFLNGYVSQLALRRADFSSTVASSGAAGLVKKINDLVDRQMAGG